MSTPIVRLFALIVVLFGVLVAFTSRWTVFEAEELRGNALNTRQILAEQRIRRGLIRADDDTLIARSVKGAGDVYRRTYPTGPLFGHPVGYSFTRQGRSGLERHYNEELTGADQEISSIIDELRGREREGDDLITTLDPTAQRTAVQALNGQRGSVVAIEPTTGAVKAMVSSPGFDPREVPRRFPRLLRAEGSPLLNRATQAGYAPGSTMKVVTAVAAIDSGRYTPQSTVDGSNNKPISGVPLRNFGGRDFGPIDLTTALTHSVNTVWAEVGEKLGRGTMGRYMSRFGFYRKPPLDLPRDERRASGEFLGQDLLDPESDRIDVGRMAIGQDKLAVTPLQMAMVVAAIANGGELMEPHLADEIRDRDGRVVDDVDPDSMGRVMKRSTAEALEEMMSKVVQEGTGTAAALSGINVAGKTGTAEIDVARNINQPWFIAFAPVERPRIAIAVTVERSSGQGGTVAAPIAKQVLQTLLR